MLGQEQASLPSLRDGTARGRVSQCMEGVPLQDCTLGRQETEVLAQCVGARDPELEPSPTQQTGMSSEVRLPFEHVH